MNRWILFQWVWTPAATLAAIGFTAVSVMKARKLAIAVGLAAVAMAAYVMVLSWGADSADMGDLAVAVSFMFFVVPLVALSFAGAMLPGRPGSRWLQRTSPPKLPVPTGESSPQDM